MSLFADLQGHERRATLPPIELQEKNYSQLNTLLYISSTSHSLELPSTICKIL